MDRPVRLRLILAAPVLGAVYYYLLIFLIGLTSATPWPSWWIGTLPNRHVAALIWIIGRHTIGVFSAAIPIAFATVLVLRKQAMLLGIIVGVIATILEVLPSLTHDIWPLVWNNHPIFFITDQIKRLVAVPGGMARRAKPVMRGGSEPLRINLPMARVSRARSLVENSMCSGSLIRIPVRSSPPVCRLKDISRATGTIG